VTVHVNWNESVCSIRIDRPDKRNAVDLATLQAIRVAQTEASTRGARVVVLSGEPPAFCSGADLGGVELGEFTDTLLAVLRGFGDLGCITLAAVEGAALGAGSQLAAACDLRMASPTSRFGVPAAKLGLAVDTWTVARLGREAGWSVARRMLLTGESFGADELAGGFVHRIGSHDEAMEWATALSEVAPLTVRAHKAALERAFTLATGADESPSLAEVERARLAAWQSNDAFEGRTAFMEKRTPKFRGD
jgi:enoyl-CoA hydratase